ncbi:GTP cyclohydrolase I [Nocardia transvalensis]|uniref:GTP cyclohydrolase I n=1 Tax=Nocardia transvalensis TaxID=37333 RepID=UPI0018957BC7|nr:GTP cyclohydrolase I [Nocardia transvalensis]MBF6332400.1 GTP cyclohydrolase I [Nocardia transvalensis]
MTPSFSTLVAHETPTPAPAPGAGCAVLDQAATAVTDLLTAFGIDEGDHTADTPKRVAKAWAHRLAGYREDPVAHLDRTFPAPHHAGPVIVSGIRVASTCAHHLLPFTGTATVAYAPAPQSRIVGLSKLSRLVDGYARRLQVQERLGTQVADAVYDRLTPRWACVLITAEHQCMTLRGVEDPHTVTTTRTIRGHISDADLHLVLSAHRDATRKSATA